MKPLLGKVARYLVLPLGVLLAIWFAYVFLVYGFWVHWLWAISAALLLLVALPFYRWLSKSERGSREG